MRSNVVKKPVPLQRLEAPLVTVKLTLVTRTGDIASSPSRLSRRHGHSAHPQRLNHKRVKGPETASGHDGLAREQYG